MVTQFKSSKSMTVKATENPGSAFFDPETLPWTDWVMSGTYFKLLNINPINGGFTMLLKVEPNTVAPVHAHYGAIDGIILQGRFSYEDDHGFAGNYLFEGAGIRHIPDSGSEDLIIFAVVHGPIGGFNDDGSIAGIVDARMMYDLAMANNAGAHIERPSHWL